MSAAPTLIFQMHRLGDLVLSFPLFSWLLQAEPERPVWVVAEPAFFTALVPLAPSVVFFPPSAIAELRKHVFHRVINLGHSPEIAREAGLMRAEQHYGLYTLGEEQHMGGPWFLYRASLVHNNRHNLFHWADLNAMDVVGVPRPETMLRTAWPEPRPPQGSGRIGLFVGASEEAKRPGPQFWGDLALDLAKRGCKPVFLGGRAERSLAFQAARHAGMIHSNLCDQFDLVELVQFLGQLDLLITPDTGPMHIAAWAGTLTLNLSMGPVNPWETAPFPPGHMVLRPTCSCSGCWQCARPGQSGAPCREFFLPARVASLARSLLAHEDRLPRLPNLQLSRTRRVRQGLFDLLPQDGRPYMPQRRALGDFWQQWFLERLGGSPTLLPDALRRLHAKYPLLLHILRKSLPALSAPLALGLRRSQPLQDSFWTNVPPALRPLSSFVLLLLQNANYSRPAWLAVLEHVEHLDATLRQG